VKSANDIKIALEQAMALHQQGQVERAEAMYHNVLTALPDEPNALHLLGVAAGQRNDLENGEKLIRKAIQVHPGVSAYYNNLAGILLKKGDMPDAIAQYEKAFKLAPKDEAVRKALIETAASQTTFPRSTIWR
jgi:Flp pilus assembly protein TadD